MALERRGRELHDGRVSRGFVMVEAEAIEADISGDAFRLLCLLRLDCRQRETDGEVDPRALRAQAAFAAIGPRRRRRLLAELHDAGLMDEQATQDLNYLVWNPSSEQAAAGRQEAAERKRAQRERAARGGETAAPGRPLASEPAPSAEAQRKREARARLRDDRTKRDGRNVTDVRTECDGRNPIEIEREREREELLPVAERQPPVDNPGPQEALPPGAVARASLLEGMAEEILIRPLSGEEKRLVLEWAQLRRGGELVPLAEIAECCRREMARPGGNGVPASSLAWADRGVRTLARQPLDHQVVRPRAAPRPQVAAAPTADPDPTPEDRERTAGWRPRLRAAAEALDDRRGARVLVDVVDRIGAEAAG